MNEEALAEARNGLIVMAFKFAGMIGELNRQPGGLGASRLHAAELLDEFNALKARRTAAIEEQS